MITHLFVYGTLRPGQRRWPFLEPFVVDEGHDDCYPAARFDGCNKSYGRIYSLRIDRLAEALELLDEVEGAMEDLFERVAITIMNGVDAWAYE